MTEKKTQDLIPPLTSEDVTPVNVARRSLSVTLNDEVFEKSEHLRSAYSKHVGFNLNRSQFGEAVLKRGLEAMAAELSEEDVSG